MKIIEALQSSFSQYEKGFFGSLVNEQICTFFIFKTYPVLNEEISRFFISNDEEFQKRILMNKFLF